MTTPNLSAPRNSLDEATRTLIDDLFADKVQRARNRPMDQRLLDGPRLFESSCQMMRNGIRTQFPSYSPEQVEAELRRRLAIKRQIDEAGIYTDAGVLDE